ncbi:MAG: tetratricopeptide repeat protein [Rhodospirillales bacterium]
MTVSTLTKKLAVCLVLAVLAGCASKAEQNAAVIADSLGQAAAGAEVSGEYALAANRYRRLLAKRPESRDALLGLARNLRYTGDAKMAVGVLKAAAKRLGGDALFLLETGKARLAVGDAAGAVESLKAAIEKDGGNWEAFAALGIAHDLLQAYGDARAAYLKALKLSDNDPAVLNNMAISAALAGDIDLAVSTLEGAPKAARNNPQIRQNLALFYGIKGDLDRAEALARFDLDDASVLNNLAIYSRFRANRAKATPKGTPLK